MRREPHSGPSPPPSGPRRWASAQDIREKTPEFTKMRASQAGASSPLPWAQPPPGPGLPVSPVPVSTFTFWVFLSFTATRFSTLAMSSQASPRP